MELAISIYMKIYSAHSWPQNVEQAREIQQKLRSKVIKDDRFADVNYVAGVDVGFEDNYATTVAAVAVLTFPQLELAQKAIEAFHSNHCGYLCIHRIKDNKYTFVTTIFPYIL